VKSVESLVAEKVAVTAKEKELIDGLNAVLSKMGYRVVVATAVAKRRGRPPASATGKRRGRPPGSGKKRRGPGRPPKAKSAPKRRGRPPKAKTE
jgi:colicin import membrane protein